MPETAPLPTTETYGQITEKDPEQGGGRLNVKHQIKEPFLRFVNDDSIRHVARAIGDTNRLWIDPGSMGAPRCIPFRSPRRPSCTG